MRLQPSFTHTTQRVFLVIGLLFVILVAATLGHSLLPAWHGVWDKVLLIGLPMLGIGGWVLFQKLAEDEIRHQQLLTKFEAADRAKTDFLANMSHEIRTPLNGMLGMLDLFSQMSLNERQVEYVTTIRKSSEQLMMILNDVLDVAKIEAGELSLEEIPFDAASCVNDVAETFLLTARYKGINLLVQHDTAHSCRVVGDPGRFRQLITNLLGNAVKFTDKGYIHVAFTQVSDATADGRALFNLQVTDTGIGMTSEQQKSLFKRFAQAEAGTTRKYGGTGLGLAICSELARMMDGNIAVTSEAGKGSTFQVNLNLLLDKTPVPESKVQLPPLTLLRGCRVLVVDDHPLNRRIMNELLGGVGMVVHEAENAEAAEAMVAKEHYHAAILDNQLPDSNGLMLGKSLHKLCPSIQLVLHTSLGQRGDTKRFEEVGFGGYLLKPHLPYEVLDMLRVLLGRRTDTNPLFNGLQTGHSLRELREYGRRTVVLQEEATASYGRVLVVEDDPVNQQVLMALLKKLGAEVIIAKHGQEGLQMVTTATPDNPYMLVLMDMNMPVMNGPAAASAIRTFEMEEGRRPVPIVALTANAMKEHRTQCLQAGMSDYLTKPVSLEKLKTLLEKWANPETDEGKTEPMIPLEEAQATSMEADTEVVVNTTMFDTLTGGDMATSQRLLELFMESTSRSMEELSEAEFGSEDWRKTAHRLKGSAASLGLFGFSNLAAKAEDMPNGSRKDELLSSMGVAFEDIRTFAARYGV
jgi:signal transduction histidine kinase/DNA-binding response OmpR family regulator